jgi:serine/threonine protein kinase
VDVIRKSAGIAEGKYEILSVGQAGGMGEVYKVRHRLLREIRAIKVMRARTALDPERQERFMREARMVARLRHPNLAQLYDLAFHENGAAYMVLEWIDGADLARLLRAAGPPPVGDTLEIAKQALSCLDFLHREHVVHRDISTDNLMVSTQPDGRFQVKLIDLGIAKNIDGGENLTRQGLFVGKLRYAPPEALDSSRRPCAPDPRSDLYSFAVVLYELLTGVGPIAGSNEPELIAGHLLRAPRPFAETDRHRRVPLMLQEVVLKGLAKKPQDRFQTAHEFWEALAQAGREAPLALAPERTPISRSLVRFERDGGAPEDFPTLELSDGGVGEAPQGLAGRAPGRSASAADLEIRKRELDQALGRDSRDWSPGASEPGNLASSVEKEAWIEDLRQAHRRRRAGESSVVSSVIKVVREHPKIMLSAALGALVMMLVSFSGVLASSDEPPTPRLDTRLEDTAKGDPSGMTSTEASAPVALSTSEPSAEDPVPDARAATGKPSLALVSDSAELTSEVLQRLGSSVAVVLRESLASAMAEDPSAGGPRLVVQLGARLGPTPVEAYDTVLSACEAVASAHVLTVPAARSLYSRTVRRTAPRCGEAMAIAGRQLADELAPAIEPLLRETP